MNNEELNVGLDIVSAQGIKYKNNATPVGAPFMGIPKRRDTTVPEKRNNATQGITLIALIITIIVMLILAGVVLNLTIGERGIFKTAEKAGTEYKKSEIKEEIELVLIEIEAEELEKGNIITLERLTGEEHLLEKKLNEITANLGENKITGIYKGYEYEIDGNLHVTIKDNNNITVTAKIMEGTVGEEEWHRTNVKVKLTAQKGKNEDVAKIVYKINENQEIQVESKETDIIIDSEGENTITYYAISTNGNQTEKIEKKIKIDKTKPTGVTISKEEVFRNSATVNLNATDELSGISKYEIYVDDTKNMETKETTANINNLLEDTSYTVYAKAIDRAGNISENSTSIIIKTIQVYEKYPVTFEKMDGDSDIPFTTDITKIRFFFDENLKNDPYGALLLGRSSYLIFSTEKSVKIDAYSDTYGDGGGTSVNKTLKISKYNLETKQYEDYKMVTTCLREWYEIGVLETGRYMIKLDSNENDGYIRFDEWRLTEQ